MINTGLPYEQDQMKEISEKGAIVDMSAINFPEGIENSIRTVFIYLRNTGFKNITLDFSKCSYDQKLNFLLEYFQTDIINEIPILTYTWKQILLCRDSNIEVYQSILTKEEIRNFVKEYESRINDLVSFYLSTPLFLLSRIKGEENKALLDISSIECSEDLVGNENLYSLIEPEFLDALSLTYKDFSIPVKFYTKHFTLENNALFEKLTQTTFYNLIDTMATWNPEDFKEIINELEKIND